MDIGFILGKPRSGTTVFKEMLASHPLFVNLGEIFNEDNGLSFFKFLHGLIRDDVRWSSPSRRVEAFALYIRACQERARDYNPNAEVVILDVKYDQSHFVYKPWRDMNAMPFLFEIIKENSWKVIDIHRDSVFDMIVSNEVAIRSGVYHSSVGEPSSEKVQVTIDPVRLRARINNVLRSYERVETYFREYQLYIKVKYEEMFETDTGAFREELVGAVAKFFNVEDLFERSPRLRKLLRADPLSYVSNQDEVRGVIAGIAEPD